MSMIQKRLPISNMQCQSCENRIERALQRVGGVVHAKASYTAGHVLVRYDAEHCTSSVLNNAISGAGYTVGEMTKKKGKYKNAAGILVVCVFILLLGIEIIPNFADGTATKEAIKVVDDVDKVDISKDTVSVPPANADYGNGTPAHNNEMTQVQDAKQESSTVPNPRLVKKAFKQNDSQQVAIEGVGHDFQPPVVVVEKQVDSRITIDLTRFDNPAGLWEIYSYTEKKVVIIFQAKPSLNEMNFFSPTHGTFGIYKDGNIIGVIEVVDDLAKADLETIRDKYLR
ncbi:heavy-metal-associated domain-containing protein [Sporomusa sp.]|uniref:heavy-metal-associated domain-containing protein n=1 Tax=Sporomusa sp. TaxID=2078658 RepID=UPI002C8D0F53|nr:cation transporter [Sporomusa sp.]HWR42805.1 cation transporter [Sporomusa sp.]